MRFKKDIITYKNQALQPVRHHLPEHLSDSDTNDWSDNGDAWSPSPPISFSRMHSRPAGFCNRIACLPNPALEFSRTLSKAYLALEKISQAKCIATLHAVREIMHDARSPHVFHLCENRTNARVL